MGWLDQSLADWCAANTQDQRVFGAQTLSGPQSR
jgi:hypothetical protein